MHHFFPSTVGGDSIKAYYSWKKGENKERVLTAVILDRFLGLLTLIIFAIISLLFSHDLSEKIPGITFWIIILALGAVVISYFILMPPIDFAAVIERKEIGIISKIAGFIYKIDSEFSQFANKKAKLFYSFILSVLLQLIVVFFYFLI